jgi:phosphoribosylformimino-5-aminoimidazole carboxamide ribotide isomerase
MTIDLYPAIDIRGGQVVRLRQGDYNDETVYGDDPATVAQSFVDQGSRWIHMVDLDAAKTGEPTNRPVIAKVANAVAGRALLQVGGGVRSAHDAVQLRDAGVARVVMGSAAVAQPAIVNEVADVIAVAVGLDHRGGDVAVHGWTEQSGQSLYDMLGLFPRASVFVITDISRDGMLQGPDIEGLRTAVSVSSIPVIASGGVASLDDVRELATIEGLGGVIAGKAIYEKRFTVREAVDVLA